MTFRKTEDELGLILEVPDEFNPNVLVDTRVHEDDLELESSGVDLSLPLESPIMRGLEIPKEKMRSKLTPFDKLRYEEAAEVMMSRGCLVAMDMAKLMGISHAFAKQLIAAVKDRWQTSITPGLVNQRREMLYLEAERIKEHCWNGVKNNSNAQMQLRFMQLILAAGQRQSALIGAEKLNVSVDNVTASHKTAADFQSEFPQASEMSADDIHTLGDIIARALSDKGRT